MATQDRLAVGRQDSCTRCGQDIEWHGRARGWRDRGNGQDCLPYQGRDGIVRPKGKHRRYTRGR